jgi:hypothetical protein
VTTDLDALHRDLLALARHDPACTVFGASAHHWRSTPVPAADLDRFEQTHRLRLPAAYRRWLEVVGVGAGPFYGLSPLPTNGEPGGPFPGGFAAGQRPDAGAYAGTATLTSQGCGYFDVIVLTGPRAGEVWVDFSEGGGPLAPWYPSLDAWLGAWLRRSRAEWLENTVADHGVPPHADRDFVAACVRSAEEVVGGLEDPMLAQYPLQWDRLHLALGRAHLAAGRVEQAEAAFAQAVGLSREPGATAALCRCLVAEAKGDHEGRLSAADEGLAAGDGWWITKLRLLRHRRFALEALQRWDEALAALVAVAEHAPNDLFAQYDLAWVRLIRGEVDLAAKLLVGAAERGVGCDREAPLQVRVQQASAELIRALRASGQEASADALVAALG